MTRKQFDRALWTIADWFIVCIFFLAFVVICGNFLMGCTTSDGRTRPMDIARALARAACHVEPILETVETWTSGADPAHVETSTTSLRGFRIIFDEPEVLP